MFELKKLIELHIAMPHYNAHEICQKRLREKKTTKISRTKKIDGKETLNVKAPSKKRQNAIR